jgi:phytoene dehydrogenase-like protein
MLTCPAPLTLGHALLSGLVRRRGWSALHLPQLRYSVIQFLDHYFESERIKALLSWLAAQSGLPPDAPGTSFIVIWNLLYHRCGVRYPRGGSGELTQALARFITEHNGAALTNSPVKRIVIHRNRAVGVALVDGTIVQGKIIVAATHILTTARLLSGHLPRPVQQHLRSVKIANGLGVALRLATTALPDYAAYPSSDGLVHTAIQLICPSLSYLRDAWQAYTNGQLSDNPLVSIMTFSAQDKSLSPPGKHVISLWAQYFPYQLSNNMRWDQVEQTAADRILATVAQYAPNIRDCIIDQLIESPLYLERELGLVRGDLQHLQLSPGQMFMLRPVWGLSQYRTPIDGLYLTGSSTHPGGGIMGMSGYNAAHVILRRETR